MLELGLIVGIVVGVVLAIGGLALVMSVYIKHKRNRDTEYARAAKVQRNSTMNAGVYNDLSTVSPIVKKPVELHKDITEMERLNYGDEEEI